MTICRSRHVLGTECIWGFRDAFFHFHQAPTKDGKVNKDAHSGADSTRGREWGFGPITRGKAKHSGEHGKARFNLFSSSLLMGADPAVNDIECRARLDQDLIFLRHPTALRGALILRY